MTAVNQTLGVATTLSADWANDPMDGMLGMAFQSVSQLQTQPFFQTVRHPPTFFDTHLTGSVGTARVSRQRGCEPVLVQDLDRRI